MTLRVLSFLCVTTVAVNMAFGSGECCGMADAERTRRINVWYPGEQIELRMNVTNAAEGVDYELRVFDWENECVLSRPYDARCKGKVEFAANELVKFGAYFAQVTKKGSSDALGKCRFARLTSREVTPCPWLGTCTHAVCRNRPQYADGRFIDMMQAAGVGLVREDYPWPDTERTTPGVYAVPEKFDRHFTNLERHGITWVLLMSCSNPIYANKLDPDGFAGFCGFTARHFKGRAKWYEIFNEPQNTDFRRVYPHYGRDENSNLIWQVKFSEFAQKAVAAIKASDPAAKVAVTGEDVQPFLKDLIRLGAAKNADAISFHPYCHKQIFPERTYWFADGGKELREWSAVHGGTTKFCITEIGWTTFGGDNATFHAVAGSYPLSTPKMQAQYMTRMYLLSRATGLEFVCNYGWIDEGPNRSYTEHNFGQITIEAEPKPVFAATAFLTRFIGTDEFVGELSPRPAEWRCLAFKGESGRKFAMWNVEGGRTVDFPSELANARFFDMMGNPIAVPRDRDGRLKLTESVVYAEVR